MRLALLLLVIANGALAAWAIGFSDVALTPQRPDAGGNLEVLDAGGSVATGASACRDLVPGLPSGRARALAREWRDRVQAVWLSDLPGATLHWVHLPPRATLQDAVDDLAELRAAGLADVALATGRELANSVSIGLFGDRDHAMKRADRVRELGFPVRITERAAPGKEARITVQAARPPAPPFGYRWREADCGAG